MCDCEPPDLYNVKTVTTRKQHQCCECHLAISKDEQAEKIDALYDGTFQTFYTCLTCTKLRDFIWEKLEPECRVHGEIYDLIYESGFVDESDREIAKGRYTSISTLVPWLKRGVGGRFELVEI